MACVERFIAAFSVDDLKGGGHSLSPEAGNMKSLPPYLQ